MRAIPDPEVCPFLPLWDDDEPSAGRILGLGRSASYKAAERGEIPTVKLGHRKVVPTQALRSMAMLDPIAP